MKSAMELSQVKGSTKQRKALQAIFEVILCVALSVGCWFTLFSMFPNPMDHTLTIVLIIGCPVIFYLVSKLSGIGRYLIFYVFIAVALFFIIMYKPAWNGFMVFANIIVEVLNEELSLGMIGFETTGDVGQWAADVMYAFIPVILMVSAAISYSVVYKEAFLGLFLTALPVIIGLCLKAIPSLWLLSLLFLAWAGLFVLSTVAKPASTKKNRPVYIQNEKQSSLPMLFMVIIMLILLAFILLFSDESYTPPREVDDVRDSVVAAEEHLRYDKLNGDKIDSLSQGDLEDVHPLNYTDNKVMDVRMDIPQSMYLRGFVGGFYEGEKWSPSEDWAFSGEYKGLTQWLAQQGFYPWCQQDALYRISEDYDLIKLDVDNVNGNSKCTYMPYEAAMSGDITPDKVNYFRDAGAYSRGFMGDREYSLTMFVPKFMGYDKAKMDTWLLSMAEKPGFDEYADKEAVYRRFVYDTYLYVPEEAETALKGDSDLIDSISGKEIDSVIFGIRKNFSEKYTYDLETDAAPKDKDELGYFLNESRTGNDMHFATAATLMFRQSGIAARYAEGYYISPERIKLYTELDDARIQIPDSYSHSWVEIYVDGIGWTPVEVIPGFYDMKKTETEEEQPDEELNKEEEKYKQQEKPIESDSEGKGEDEKDINPLIYIAILIVILILAYEIIGRHRMKKRRAGFGRILNNSQVYVMYRYIVRLMKLDGHKMPANPYHKLASIGSAYDENTDMKFKNFLDNVSAVRFGQKTWDEETHKNTAKYIEQLTKTIYDKQTKWKRFLMRFVYFFV